MGENDRGQGMLTDHQRAWLADQLRSENEIEPGSSTERNIRRRIRNRVYNALLDGTTLLGSETFRESGDLQRIFDPTQTPRELANPDREAQMLEQQVATLLAIIYIGLSKREPEHQNRDFGEILDTALQHVETHTGWQREEFEFEVKFNRNPSEDSVLERFDRGHVSEEEAIWLLRQELITSDEFSEYIKEHWDSE